MSSKMSTTLPLGGDTTRASPATEIRGKILKCYNLLSIWHLVSVLK
jgi:hypothetical protein